MIRLFTFLVVISLCSIVAAQTPNSELEDYFRAETAKLSGNSLTNIKSLDEWKAKREIYHAQLKEMLGLDPWPEKTDLQAEITGQTEQEGIVVENIVYQSRPGLYVTGNLYRPAEVKEPLPAILYVCGHGGVKKDGVSYGNKVHYHHHGAWFARNGYVCLTIDSLQLGEIEGIHHGTYRYDMWWWLNRGYTPAGVEAWNCVRALDYLETRKEVDASRFGVTGRSGGGAYSWWIAALDERIKCAVPVAGITDLENHVVDGCVDGHCDCMYMVNTYRWDYPLVAAMVAPRPLLISNTDRDGIFPLDGIVRTHAQVRHIYELYKKPEDIALQITAGPHKDTQELRIHAFRWFNHYLKNNDELISDTAHKVFEPEQLRVLHNYPEGRKNEDIHETFVAAAAIDPPASKEAWEQQRDQWKADLSAKTFSGWPDALPKPELKQAFSATHKGVQLQAYDFKSQDHVPLRLYVANRAGLEKTDLVVLNLLDEKAWQEFLATYAVGFADELRSKGFAAELPAADQESFDQTARMFESFAWTMAYVAPRGIGPSAFEGNEKRQTQIQRRFMLLGQTLDGMRVYDSLAAISAVQSLESLNERPLWLQASRNMAGVALYTSIYSPIDLQRIDLHELPTSHRDGPVLLNINRILHMPQALAMAAERTRVVVYGNDADAWDYVRKTSATLGWPEKQFQLRQLPPAQEASGEKQP